MHWARLGCIVIALCILGALTSGSYYAQSSVDLDCVDFARQIDAQAVYERIPGDPYGLDPDRDGVACEARPPSTGQWIGYLLTAAVAVACAVSFLLALQRRQERLSSRSTISEKITEIEIGVSDAVRLLESAEFADPSHGSGAKSKLTEEPGDRLKQLAGELRQELVASARRNVRAYVTAIVAVVIMSVAGSVLVSTFIP